MVKSSMEKKDALSVSELHSQMESMRKTFVDSSTEPKDIGTLQHIVNNEFASIAFNMAFMAAVLATPPKKKNGRK